MTAALLAAALAVQACEPASASSRVGTRFFGIHAPGMPDAFPATPRGSVDLTTNGVYWPDLETSNGVWNLDRLTALVDQAHAHGAQPMLVLGQTPAWTGRKSTAMPPMRAWQRYVRHVVKEYGARLDYQIWPEANIVQNWTGSPKQLAQLTAAASNIIHNQSRRALVVGPAMVMRMKYQRTFMNAFYATHVGGKRIGSYVDAVAIDAYPETTGTPEDSAAIIHQARTILRQHRVRAPLWNVEMNYGVIGGHASVAQSWSNRKQASYVVRNDVLDAAAGIKRVYWLGWFPFKEGTIQFVKADGTTPTVAAKALRVVRTWLLGQHVRGCAQNKRIHLYTCTLVKSGRASWVYWTTRGKHVVHVPPGSRKVVTMTGRVSGTHGGKALTVTSAPVWVHH